MKNQDKIMSLEDFKKTIDWMCKQKVFRKRVKILGGEPTLHPNFKEMINYLKEKKIVATILTNFYFDKKNLKYFLPEVVEEVLGTYYPSKKLDYNVKELIKKGNTVVLSYNISKKNKNYKYIIDATKKFGLKKVRFSIAHPSSRRKNDYVKIEELTEVGKVVMDFVRDCVNNDLTPVLDCTLPLCMLGDKKNIKYFTEKVTNSTEPCGIPLDLTPDMDFIYCFPLAEYAKTNINEVKSFKDLTKALDVSKLREKFLFEDCKTCVYWYRKQCQGGCLALKT